MIKNYLNVNLEDLDNCHDGIGTLKHIKLFDSSEFSTNVRFFNYTVLPPGTTIGMHEHGDDEEFYVVLEGEGIMHVNGESFNVSSGAVIVNPPFGSHGIDNTGSTEMKLLVFEVYNSSEEVTKA